MGTQSPRPVTLDSGALIAIERGDEKTRALLNLSARGSIPIYLPTVVLAEVWRGGDRTQARLAVFLNLGRRHRHLVDLELTVSVAQKLGLLVTRVEERGVSVTDAMVAWGALEYDGVAVTSDPDDLRKGLPLERIRIL